MSGGGIPDLHLRVLEALAAGIGNDAGIAHHLGLNYAHYGRVAACRYYLAARQLVDLESNPTDAGRQALLEHAARLQATRKCECGTEIEWHRKYCGDCASDRWRARQPVDEDEPTEHRLCVNCGGKYFSTNQTRKLCNPCRAEARAT